VGCGLRRLRHERCLGLSNLASERLHPCHRKDDPRVGEAPAERALRGGCWQRLSYRAFSSWLTVMSLLPPRVRSCVGPPLCTTVGKLKLIFLNPH
ncbi:MAG: hypothetical protein ACKOCZ_03085, partial [Betaproteobacteria bacterium]